MISLEKWYILIRFQKLPKNVGDLGKLIVAKGFNMLPNVQKIAQSGHTDCVRQAERKELTRGKYYNMLFAKTDS